MYLKRFHYNLETQNKETFEIFFKFE